MSDWRSLLHYDPLAPLLSSGDRAIAVFTTRDLLEQPDQDITTLWNLPEGQKIARKQQPDGSWKYPGGNPNLRSSENYDQLETFRNLGYLVDMYGFDDSQPVIRKAANFLFSFQTDEGPLVRQRLNRHQERLLLSNEEGMISTPNQYGTQ